MSSSTGTRVHDIFTKDEFVFSTTEYEAKLFSSTIQEAFLGEADRTLLRFIVEQIEKLQKKNDQRAIAYRERDVVRKLRAVHDDYTSHRFTDWKQLARVWGRLCRDVPPVYMALLTNAWNETPPSGNKATKKTMMRNCMAINLPVVVQEAQQKSMTLAKKYLAHMLNFIYGKYAHIRLSVARALFALSAGSLRKSTAFSIQFTSRLSVCAFRVSKQYKGSLFKDMLARQLAYAIVSMSTSNDVTDEYLQWCICVYMTQLLSRKFHVAHSALEKAQKEEEEEEEDGVRKRKRDVIDMDCTLRNFSLTETRFALSPRYTVATDFARLAQAVIRHYTAVYWKCTVQKANFDELNILRENPGNLVIASATELYGALVKTMRIKTLFPNLFAAIGGGGAVRQHNTSKKRGAVMVTTLMYIIYYAFNLTVDDATRIQLKTNGHDQYVLVLEAQQADSIQWWINKEI